MKFFSNFLMEHFTHWANSHKSICTETEFNLNKTNKPNPNIYWRCSLKTSFGFLQTINLSGGRRPLEGGDITYLRLYTSTFRPWPQAVSTWQQCHKSSCEKITVFSLWRTTMKPDLTIYLHILTQISSTN